MMVNHSSWTAWWSGTAARSPRCQRTRRAHSWEV